AFVATEPELAENAIVFVRFSLASGSNNLITVQFDVPSPLSFAEGKVTDSQGQVLAYFDKIWTWERERAHAKIGTGKFATLAIATKPLASAVNFSFGNSSYDKHRKSCVDSWNKVLA